MVRHYKSVEFLNRIQLLGTLGTPFRSMRCKRQFEHQVQGQTPKNMLNKYFFQICCGYEIFWAMKMDHLTNYFSFVTSTHNIT